MLVEDGVEVVVVAAGIARGLELAGQASVGRVDAPRLVVALPELDGPRVRREEDGAAEERAERGGEQRGDDRLHEQHGRVRHAERLRERVERRAPRDLPRGDVRDDELQLEHELGRLGEQHAHHEVVDEEGLREAAGGHVVVEEQLGERDDQVLGRGLREARADRLHGANHRQNGAGRQPELGDEGRRVARDHVEEERREQDVPLELREPEERPLEPHEPGRLVHLELVVLVRAHERARKAQPRQLFPQLGHDVVQQEAHHARQDPQNLP